DNAVVVRGRVNWREDKMSVFGSDLIALDLSGITGNDEEPPLVLLAAADMIDTAVVSELKSTLLAHKGDTPVHIKLVGKRNEILLALYDYPVNVSSMLMGEIKGIPGITVAA
ncbi:MAG: polymerase subunit alpha, partial [Pseudonocardiales bacterium]|nr:polymerase subunit alpha [Pseudonocardiales bacterium]